MDKAKEIQERIERYLVLYRSGEYNKRKTAEKISQLFKVKLPPRLKKDSEFRDGHDYALQQVKEALEKAGVECIESS